MHQLRRVSILLLLGISFYFFYQGARAQHRQENRGFGVEKGASFTLSTAAVVAQATVYLRFDQEIALDAERRQQFEEAALGLLRSSNFNSVSHQHILQMTIPENQQAYRKMVSGNYLSVTFDAPVEVQTRGGGVETHEIVIGLGEQYADALFTIDATGRVVVHGKYSGTLAIELLALVEEVAQQ